MSAGFLTGLLEQKSEGRLTMRVYGPNGTALSTAPSAARRTASGTFTLSEAEEAPKNVATTSLRTISSLGALMALQGVEDPTEKRKRAVVKGRNALDVLDKLKLSLIDGDVDPAMFSRLKVAAQGLAEETGDPGLDAVMGEIDLRVAVELAKAGIR